MSKLYEMVNFHIEDEAIEVIRGMIACSADLNQIINGETILTICCMHSHLKAVQILMDFGVDKNKNGSSDMTPLCIACHTGNAKLVKLLLESGCDINLRAKNGHTPIEVACIKNRLAAVKILMDAGCDLKTPSGVNGFTPLMLACVHTNPIFVEMMINKLGDVDNMITVLLTSYLHNREVYDYLCQKYFPDSEVTPDTELNMVSFAKKAN